MTVHTIAPAKINWTLEVLGRRPDGYHEVRTILQTIDLCDEVETWPSGSLSLEVEGDHSPTDDDHTLQAARLLAAAVGTELTARIWVRKRVPVAAGLGGGSSDAAAVLRSLPRLFRLDPGLAQLSDCAAKIGSDVPFFLRGGTALATGRGDAVTPLPDVPERWLVLVVPPFRVPDKTRRMYGRLSDTDFTDGSRTEALAEAIRGGNEMTSAGVFNAFDRAAQDIFPGLGALRNSLGSADGTAVHLAGAGPALFKLHDSEQAARDVAASLRLPEAHVFVARTLRASAATWVTGATAGPSSAGDDKMSSAH